MPLIISCLQVVVPQLVAMTLTYPEMVGHWVTRHVCRCVLIGVCVLCPVR